MVIEFDIKESSVIKGVYIITPNKFKDLRGEIWSAYMHNELKDRLLPPDFAFVHDKFATSKYNVLRGIHGDGNTYKLVTCVYGEMLQVVVDCRKDSSTHLKYEMFKISPNEQKLILLPPNMGNAHYVLSDSVVYYYKCAYKGEYTDADGQFTYAWNDERIGIEWGDINPILSARDIKAKGE